MINIPYPDETVLNNFFDEIKFELLQTIKRINASKTVSINKKKYRVTKQIKQILTWLENENNLKKFLLLKPKYLIKTIQIVEKNFKKARYSKEALHKIFYRVFVDYGYNKLNKLQFIQNIDLSSCPYCNRNYIFSINKKASIKPEIDHFYPKSIYPYLAVSYFNLIPSCPTCNGFGAKEAKDTFYIYPITHPYEVKEHDFKFSISPQNIEYINVEKNKYDFNSFEIELYGNKDNLDIFKLEELYKQHKDIVLELLIKKAYYPHSYIKELKSFGFNEEEIYRFLFSNYKEEKDLHKRPLSKLIRDISEELDLI